MVAYTGYIFDMRLCHQNKEAALNSDSATYYLCRLDATKFSEIFG